MSNLTRLASRPAGAGRAAPQGYRIVGILIVIMAILVGWGQIGNSGAAWPASANVARAATSTYNYPLYAWGFNSSGQLGNGTTTDSNTPLKVSLPAGVVPIAIGAGFTHNLAIGDNGKLYAWGDNASGELGNSSTIGSSVPVTISLPAGALPTAIVAGFAYNLAIGDNGKLYAWGNNRLGQLGNGSTTNSSVPVTVSLPAGVKPVAIAAGSNHSLAIGDNGQLYTWGDNRNGQLGNGTTSGSNPNPLPIGLPGGVTPTAIAAGDYHSLAAGSDGKLYAWGYDYDGELGNGTNKNNAVPNPVVVSLPAGITPTAITAGNGHSLAIGSDGNLYTWGSNRDGQLGNGTTTDSSIPVTASLPAGVTPTAIAAGDLHSLAIGSDNKLYTWGYNLEGELGIGSNSNSSIPVVAGSTAGINHPLLAARYYHSLAQLALPSQIAVSGGAPQTAQVGTAFSVPLVATARDVVNNPVSSATVTFTAPGSGASSTFAGGSPVYTATTDASGQVTATLITANAIIGNYSVTATVGGVSTPATFALTNFCNPLLVTLSQDDGSCGTLRQAVLNLATPLSSKAKTITIDLSAGSVISLTSGLTLTSGVAITTTAPCGIGAGNTMLPPVTIKGVGANSGVGLTLAGHNQLYGLWVRGFSGVQIKAPAGSSTKMQCVRASKS